MRHTTIMADHEHRHGTETHGQHGPGHSHGVVDPSIASTERGLWALKWSFLGLLVTALFQLVITAMSGSVALLADTIHNFGDTATAIPARASPSSSHGDGATRRFTYGLGRVEDFAGLLIILTICSQRRGSPVRGNSAPSASPSPSKCLWAVISLPRSSGSLGNEAVAIFRIRVGNQIGSAALVADGHHARVDGFTSLAVLLGAIGVWLGYPIADPIVGLLISVAIFALVWQSARSVIVRMLDGVDSSVLDAISDGAFHVPDVQEVTDVRARWIGHRLHAEVSIAVPADLSVGRGHDIAKEVRHQLLHHLPHLGGVLVHVDPHGQAGERHHRLDPHSHDGLPTHAHE